MPGPVQKELGVISDQLRRNGRELLVICSAVLFLTLAQYHSFGEYWADAVVLYATLPLAVILLLMRRNPADFGLRPGNWRLWCAYVAVTCLAACPLLFAFSKVDSLNTYYSLHDFDIQSYLPRIIVYLTAWEFLFRGYLLFGLKDRFKEASILIQMVPFVLLHLGKPEIETLSTIPMGIYLGYVVYRGNSFLPAVVIHIFINVLFRIFTNML